MYYDRLLTLAKFLDILLPEKFDFSSYVAGAEGGCGTVCCAVGWMPKVFPKTIGWDPDHTFSGTVIDNKWTSWISTAEKFFNLDSDTRKRLFVPSDDLEYSGLPGHATPSQVAQHIRSVVEEHCVEEFKGACRKMSPETRLKWSHKLKKSRRMEGAYHCRIKGSDCYCVLGAYISSQHKIKSWLKDNATVESYDHMPEFRWYDAYDPDSSCPDKECCAVVLNDEFHYTFAQFRKLINGL